MAYIPGQIQGPVGKIQQLIVILTVTWILGDPQGNGQSTMRMRCIAVREILCHDATPKFFDGQFAVFKISFGQEKKEFFAAEASHKVILLELFVGLDQGFSCSTFCP